MRTYALLAEFLIAAQPDSGKPPACKVSSVVGAYVKR
jgi:hypothetical protein